MKTAFLLLSLPLVALSRRSLFGLKNHGLYRFVVWECILWLAIRNYRYMIVERFDAQQIIASMLMIASLGFVVAAVSAMHRKGGASRGRRDPTLFAFEKTTVLVESGIFRWVRHPMYSSLLLLAWGILLRHIEPSLVVVAVVATCAGLIAVWTEERENLEYFGDGYRQYMRKTKRFIPYVV